MNADPAVRGVYLAQSSKPPKLREARFEDYSQMAALALKFELDTEECEAWMHLWTGNPALREVADKFPMGWVLEAADGKIAGYLGNIPLSYEFEGKKLLAAAVRSWVVDSGYRAYSLLLLATYYQQTNVDIFLATSVNSQSAVASSVFQNVQVPVGAWDRTLFWITNPQGFSESFFRKQGWHLAKWLSYPGAAAISIRDQLAGSRFRKAESGVGILPCASFDDRFDAFWTALKKKKSNILLAVRSRETLEWHFKFALRQNAAWIYTIEGDAGLAAYAVFLRQDRRQVGLRRVCLVDFQCLEQEKAPAFFAAMLETAFERCRQESIHMLELIGLAPSLEEIAGRASPHRRQLASWMYFYKAKDRGLGERLTSPEVWEPALFDGDSSL
ncbi:MAG: hypothetical protein ACLP6G_22835 [Terriglobales bacterium]